MNLSFNTLASFSCKSVTNHLSSSEASSISWFCFISSLTGSKLLNQAARASDLSLLKSLRPGTKFSFFIELWIGKISPNSIGQFLANFNSSIDISEIVNASPLTASGKGLGSLRILEVKVGANTPLTYPFSKGYISCSRNSILSNNS